MSRYVNLCKDEINHSVTVETETSKVNSQRTATARILIEHSDKQATETGFCTEKKNAMW